MSCITEAAPGADFSASSRRRAKLRFCRALLLALLAGVGCPEAARTQAAQGVLAGDTINPIALDTVRVGARADQLIGIAATSSEGRVGAVDLLARPIAREGELLETIPGMVVTQHSGEGKANQFFVRGFNLDHGTDFHTRVEGMPVNLPSHGHGQGYTDLNFLIPEFVSLLDYRLGVYHAELGDFGSAGGAEIHLVRRLAPFVQTTVGQNRFGRVVAGGSTVAGGGDLLFGAEARVYDGPWEREQDLRKVNALARYSIVAGRSQWSLLGMGYRNRWNASDQIPKRAVESELIGRFGGIDPTDGGASERYSLSGSWRRVGDFSFQEVQLFGIFSDLDLFSNFTYFLERPDAGDQFRQQDRRWVVGGNAKHLDEIRAFGTGHAATIGLQHRTDLIGEVGLALTSGRRLQRIVREDAVTETATGAYLELVSRWRPWIRTVFGLRGDAYSFDVTSNNPLNSGRSTAGIVSPKGSVILAPTLDTELYLSGGFGFHSNDARGVTITGDPMDHGPVERVDPLVRSKGLEVGLRASPIAGLRSTVTAWLLRLDSELLFVGDAGATEPTNGSERRGITWANFYRPISDLALDADLSLARARLQDSEQGDDRIPGAMERVFSGGVAWLPSAGVYGSLRARHFGAYPLVEDNSVRADAATLLNGEAGYAWSSGVRVEAAILNLLDSGASDVEYFYASRLPGEPLGGIEDVHFHPVEPRQLRLTVSWMF